MTIQSRERNALILSDKSFTLNFGLVRRR